MGVQEIPGESGESEQGGMGNGVLGYPKEGLRSPWALDVDLILGVF